MPKRLLSVEKYPLYLLLVIWRTFASPYLKFMGGDVKKYLKCYGFPIISKLDASVILRMRTQGATLAIENNAGISGATICAAKKVGIGENVLIGANSIVLKGVGIGRDSVIGTGSIVTTEIPQNCVPAGNPVKIIKTLA